MSKVLKFQAITDGSYRASEIEALEEAFIAWVNDFDGDIIEGTEDTSVIENDVKPEPVISDEIRAQVIKEFLETNKIQIDLKFRFTENNKPVNDYVFRHEGFADGIDV